LGTCTLLGKGWTRDKSEATTNLKGLEVSSLFFFYYIINEDLTDFSLAFDVHLIGHFLLPNSRAELTPCVYMLVDYKALSVQNMSIYTGSGVAVALIPGQEKQVDIRLLSELTSPLLAPSPVSPHLRRQ
jgi:hypothetical protein